MGLLRMANVPFVGCDIFASAVAMDKVLRTGRRSGRLAGLPYVWFKKANGKQTLDEFRRAINELKRPLFMKPVHLGSSIGIAKVSSDQELEQAIEVALHYDDKVLVEEWIEPLLEITFPLMGNDDITPAQCERPLNKSEMFDFNDKYLSGGKSPSGVNNAYSEIPANIEDELTAKIKELGVRVYRTLGCTGIARVDFLVNDSTKEIFVNEVNTLPGSLYRHNWKKTGVSIAILSSDSCSSGKSGLQSKRAGRTHSNPTSSRKSAARKSSANMTKRKKVAIFDVDGTIFRSSLLIQVVDQLIREGIFPEEVQAIYCEAIRKMARPRGGLRRVHPSRRKAFTTHLAGMHYGALADASKRVVAAQWKRTYRYPRALIKELKDRGYYLLAVSHSPKTVLDKFCPRLGFDKVYGLIYEIDEEDQFTGRSWTKSRRSTRRISSAER